ncbi:MAG: YfiR family protein [Bacteroidales bacterium]|nr:YfiR family protein [Bacteroidales bacterium]
MLTGLRNKIVIAIVSVLLCLSHTAYSQYDKYKALYIYNFVKLIDWPVNTLEDEFVIGIMGDGDVVTELTQITNNKKVINQGIRIVSVKPTDDISDLQVLFISKSSAAYTVQIEQKLNGKPVLVITEHKRIKAAINFVETEASLLFEIDPAVIEKQGLKVSNTLIELGIVAKK